jgi:endonuclease YncB( thermonuclease family)
VWPGEFRLDGEPTLRPGETDRVTDGVRLSRRYVYTVDRIEKVTDGDTYWLHLDVGFRQTMLAHLRLYGWDTPEINRGTVFEKSEARRAGAVAALFLTTALAGEETVWVRTERDPDNFGRWLGEVWAEAPDGAVTTLGDLLHEARLASAWPTRWREEFDTTIPDN